MKRRILKLYRFVGFLTLLVSILLSLSNNSYTGAVIGFSKSVSSFVPICLFMAGLLILIIANERPGPLTELLVYVPKKCLEEGVEPGGWIPQNRVVPAFDPRMLPPEKIKEDFKFGDDRVLVRIKGESKGTFQKRYTGLDEEFHGVYASLQRIPSRDLEPVDERNYSDRGRAA